MKLIKSVILAGAFLLVANGSAHAQGPLPASTSQLFDLRGIGVGLVIIGAAFGIGGLAKGAVESMSRQPEIATNIQTAMIIAAALIEGVTFFALVILLMK
jgi:F-type H+-transporting ATPase subunit c